MKTVTYDETKWRLVPVELASRVQDSLGRFTSDEGFGQEDVDTADDFAATLLRGPAPTSSVNWEDDALNWGGALNDAAWAFIEACPEKSTLLFNSAKASLRQAILVYGRTVGSNAISEDIEALRKDAAYRKALIVAMECEFKAAKARRGKRQDEWVSIYALLHRLKTAADHLADVDEAMAAGGE